MKVNVVVVDRLVVGECSFGIRLVRLVMVMNS